MWPGKAFNALNASRKRAYQPSRRHDQAGAQQPAADAVRHTCSYLGNQPDQSGQRRAEKHPSEGLSCNEGSPSPTQSVIPFPNVPFSARTSTLCYVYQKSEAEAERPKRYKRLHKFLGNTFSWLIDWYSKLAHPLMLTQAEYTCDIEV